jgi:3-deoxy-D-manno-octulosonic-acid transferase
LDFVTEFKNNQLTIVVGSSWPKDEKILVDYINSMTHQVKFIIAPHNIKRADSRITKVDCKANGFVF